MRDFKSIYRIADKRVIRPARSFFSVKRNRTIGIVIACFMAVASAFTIFWGSQKFLRVVYKTVPIKGLPRGLDGLKILQISDLHSNNPEKMNLDIWKAIDKLSFDIVAITGDFVDRNAYQIEPHMEALKNLASKKPVFFCEGNHDHYSMRKLLPCFDDCGVIVLVDEAMDYEYNNEVFEIVGLEDFYSADLTASAKFFKKSDKFRLSLVHQPQHVDYLDLESSPSLTLSGHTHGGQFRFPFMPTIYAPGQGFFPKYGYGLYKRGNAKIYVSKGIGATGKMPFRIWNRPEIAVLTLKAV